MGTDIIIFQCQILCIISLLYLVAFMIVQPSLHHIYPLKNKLCIHSGNKLTYTAEIQENLCRKLTYVHRIVGYLVRFSNGDMPTSKVSDVISKLYTISVETVDCTVLPSLTQLVPQSLRQLLLPLGGQTEKPHIS